MFSSKLIFPSPCVELREQSGKTIWIKRDDLIHPIVSGNKSRKLLPVIHSGIDRVITFGGAYSNHIHATAFLCAKRKISCTGIIRGEELTDRRLHSPTLIDAANWGMELKFVSRKAYREKSRLIENVDASTCIIPEGGATIASAKGCRQIIKELSQQLPESVMHKNINIVAACGTGTTLSGLIDGIHRYLPHAKLYGIPVLKYNAFFIEEIKRMSKHHRQVNWSLLDNYHDGGYAKVSNITHQIINYANDHFDLPLEPIYTAKAFRALLDLSALDKANNAQWVFYHSGGLQGHRQLGYFDQAKSLK